MKTRTAISRIGKPIRDNCMIPYESRNGNYAGVKRIGVDKDGNPEYKYLRLKRTNSLNTFLHYYFIVPRPESWNRFRNAKHGEATYQQLQAKISQNFTRRAIKYEQSTNHVMESKNGLKERKLEKAYKQLNMQYKALLKKFQDLNYKKRYLNNESVINHE